MVLRIVCDSFIGFSGILQYNTNKRRRSMGHVNVELILKNYDDMTKAKRGQITENEIRQVTVDAMVDTGATTLIIIKSFLKNWDLKSMKKRK
jgi:hypothetical protein